MSADLYDFPTHLVAEDAGRREVRMPSGECLEIRAAQSDCADLDQKLIVFGNRSLFPSDLNPTEFDELRREHSVLLFHHRFTHSGSTCAATGCLR